jgi:hypothetical protein
LVSGSAFITTTGLSSNVLGVQPTPWIEPSTLNVNTFVTPVNVNFDTAIFLIVLVAVAVTESNLVVPFMNTYFTPTIELVSLTVAESVVLQTVSLLKVVNVTSMSGLIVTIALSVKVTLSQSLIDPTTLKLLIVISFGTGLSLLKPMFRVAEFPVAVTESIFVVPRMNTYFTPPIALLMLMVALSAFAHTTGSLNIGKPFFNSGFITTIGLLVNLFGAQLPATADPSTDNVKVLTWSGTNGTNCAIKISRTNDFCSATTESILVVPFINTYFSPTIAFVTLILACVPLLQMVSLLNVV